MDPAPELWPVLDLCHLLGAARLGVPQRLEAPWLSVLGITKGSYDDWLWRVI